MFCVLLATAAYAQTPPITLHFADGTTVTGEIVQVNETGILLRQGDGQQPVRTPWSKLSQADLKELQQNPKAEKFVEPFIEVSQAEKLKRTEVQIKEDYPKLKRPVGYSLIGAMCGSIIGIFTLLILYAANIYAAYEIAVFRAQPPALVCGVAAVAPIIGPVIFISMPTRLRQKEADWQPPAEEYAPAPEAEAAVAADQAAAAEHAAAAQAAAQPAGPPPPKVFARGQFTFNRRFFETQMPGFFAMTRPEAERDTVLTFKTAHGTFAVQRISRISATDITLQVNKGHTFEDNIVPFTEIQEVQLQRQR